jgi:TPR repeat protein
MLGLVYRYAVGVQSNLRRARALFEQGCAGEAPYACAELGALDVLGLGGRKDVRAGMRRLSAGCTRNDARSCTLLAAVTLTTGRGTMRELQQVRPYLTKGCSLGDPTACEAVKKLDAAKR